MGKIVITGASSEIGFAIASRLSESGKPMLLHCNRNQAKLASFGPETEIVQADFSDRKQLTAFIERLNDVEILVNAAACTDAMLLPQLEDVSIERMIAVNVLATTLICKAVIVPMCLKRKGIIVNLSSVTASKVFRGHSVYGGTKAYIEVLTKSLAAEYSKKGIRCNCVAPGTIDSGSMRQFVLQDHKDLKMANASGTFGTPEDVAAAVAFLCSDESRYITGTVLHVDGGHMIGL